METILEEHLSRLSEEMNNETLFAKEKEKDFKLFIDDETIVHLHYLQPELLMNARLRHLPKKNLEAFFIYLMQANYLGQGTGRSVIGLEPSEKFLTLSHLIPYEMNYTLFKDAIESYLNHLTFWQSEIDRYIREAEESF
ncbi:MAG: type III secretion system chaperone [Simkaniaceae bacterium]|nr:type III secretion system chaperone [Simkaniaceae bacterium]